MSTRIHRAVAAVAVTAASLAGTAALATPAWAADTARVSFGNLIVAGGPEDNSIRFSRSASGVVTVTDTKAAVNAGTGCVQVNTNTIRCSGVENLNVNGRDGDDFINNDTGQESGLSIPGLPGTLNGGSGNDILFGSDGSDELLGGLGNDRADATTGVDRCIAETEENCELD